MSRRQRDDAHPICGFGVQPTVADPHGEGARPFEADRVAEKRIAAAHLDNDTGQPPLPQNPPVIARPGGAQEWAAARRKRRGSLGRGAGSSSHTAKSVPVPGQA